MLDRQIASVIWESSEYGITCMMDCEVLCEDCGGIEEKDLWVIIVSLGGAIIALIIIFSCAIHYLKKKYRNKLAAVRSGSTHKIGRISHSSHSLLTISVIDHLVTGNWR